MAHDHSFKSAPEKILSEIRNVKKRHRKLTVAAERPVSIGGSVRGALKRPEQSPDLRPIAEEVAASQFYSRTYRIDHQ